MVNLIHKLVLEQLILDNIFIQHAKDPKSQI